MKLSKLAGPLLVTALSSCVQKTPPTVEGDNLNFAFQAQRNCPTDAIGNPTVGTEKQGAWLIECQDTNNNGLIDLIIETRGAAITICHTPQGIKDDC